MKTAFVVLAVVMLAVSVVLCPAEACVGARALAMGGAFTGLADDASATYWNPAALVDLPSKANFTAMYTANNRGQINYQEYVAYVAPVGPTSALGASWLRFKLTVDVGVVVVDKQDWYWVSFGRKIGPKTSFGANVRFINDSVNVSGISADTDTGFDVALYHHASDAVTLGLLVQEVNEPETTFSSGGSVLSRANWMQNWRPGIAVRLPEHVILSAEVYNATEGDIPREAGGRAFRFGAEKKFLPAQPDSGQPGFALRAGWYGNADALTVGAGVFGPQASADVALMTGDLENTWFVSASASW